MMFHSQETTHYENFPVASFWCPARLRPAIGAIYAFARTADDLADEGEVTSQQRLSDLQEFRSDLMALGTGKSMSSRWPGIFARLGPVMAEFHLPRALFLDLLSAFEQDVCQAHYRDRAELLDYCRRSANPIGRLLLHSLAQSDAICSALQLANFWQDLSVDIPRRRYYVPEHEYQTAGVNFSDLAAQKDSLALRAMLQKLVQWTRELMLQGADLSQVVQAKSGWRAGFEMRLVVQGGLKILDKIEAMNFDSLRQRPTLRALDVVSLLWRATWMRPAARRSLQGAA